MSDKLFTSSEQKRLEMLAHQRGYKTLRDYMRALLEQDAEQHGEVVPLDNEPSAEEIRAGIKQGMREALRGEYVSLETLWADDDE